MKMNKFWIVTIIFILLFPLAGICQEHKTKWDALELSDISVFLIRQVNDTISFTGTGTILRHDKSFFLVTASHVAKFLDNNAKVLFRVGNDKPLVKHLRDMSLDNNVKWIHHKIADIAITPMLKPTDTLLSSVFERLAFPISQINNNENLPHRDADVAFFGYPLVDLKLEHFSALTFYSHLSSGLITQKRADTKTLCSLFYLESPSIQGCSGSGVYVGVKKSGVSVGPNQTILFGIMHGTYSDNTGGKLAAITPSYYIFDFFK